VKKTSSNRRGVARVCPHGAHRSSTAPRIAAASTPLPCPANAGAEHHRPQRSDKEAPDKRESHHRKRGGRIDEDRKAMRLTVG
jgi:hypothetical protein